MDFVVYEGLKIFYKLESLETYPPSEDSFLLAKWVEKLAKGLVLDICTGSGIQSLVAARKKDVSKVYAYDIDENALKIAKYNAKINNLLEKIIFMKSDLFSNVPKIKFDTIIFNPPYLPEEGWEDYKTKLWTVGGKNGNEIIIKFLSNVKKHLSKNGKILMVFSSLSKKEEIDKFLAENDFSFEILEKRRFFFEELYIYKISLYKID